MGIDAIYSRRSIRKFQQREVSVEDIRRLLDAGRVAPSGKNRQPWKFVVFGGEQKRGLLAEMELGIRREMEGRALLPGSKRGIPDAINTLGIMRQAPVVVVALNTNSGSPFVEITAEQRVAEIVDSLSIGAAIENILLAAEEMGLGALWIANTFFAYRELAAYLRTENQIAVAIGYADEAPGARPRKRLEDIVEYRL